MEKMKNNKKIKIVSIRSSSDGNCTLVSNGNINILVDCGVSLKTINECLNEYNISFENINYIFITHSHSDHIKSIDKILTKYNIKIVGLRDTLNIIYNQLVNKNIKVNPKLFYPLHIKNNFFEYNKPLLIDNIKIKFLEAYHDVPCLFYKFYIDDIVFAILTDCGIYDTNILNFLSDVNYLMLECNYDVDMLKENKNYPDYLKKRISGNLGHMSNVDCSRIIYEIANKNLKLVCLSHISKNNNTEEYAYEFVNKYLNELNTKNKILPQIITASRYRYTKIYN